ncbi:MAG: glycosyltransferase family 61 protein [Cyanobacteria bacterium P01_D01_bin.44]
MLALIPKFIHRLIPKFIQKHRSTFAVASNQRKILKFAKSNKLIFLEPTPPPRGSGSIENYYHFIVDTVLPLYFVLTQTPADVIFIIRGLGIHADKLRQLFSNRIKVEDKTNIQRGFKTSALVGMNPRFVNVNSSDLEKFKGDICSYLKVDQNSQSNRILLIERLPPDPYFIATGHESGSSRRSILNHGELASALKSMVKAPFEFHNIQLEKISFEEQVDYFDKALVVIAQHGAGLANCIWMKQNSIVIELNSREELEHFKVISKLREHHYFLYKTSSIHATVDINSFTNWLLSNEKLNRFFATAPESSRKNRGNF